MSLRKGLTTALILAAMTWAFGVQAASDTAQGYRLAGIIAAGQDHVGLLELPTGGQVLVRPGSLLPGGARVGVLSDRHLELTLPNGQQLELALSGVLGRPPAPVPAATVANQSTVPTDIVTTTSRAGVHSVRQVAVTPFRMTLRAPVEAAASTIGTASPATAAAPSSAVVVQRFNALLELPAAARILEVNGQPVRDAAAAVSIADRALAAGMMAIVNVQSDQGFERIYLQPETGRP
jgi:hypothetical protein